MPFENIISCEQLLLNLDDPNWVIIDCRFSLNDPLWGEVEYQKKHIAKALYANLDKDLSGSKSPATGRHPLPDPASFCLFLSKTGVDSSKQVVVYDSTSGSFAGRLWFMLKMYGHANVAVLDGGISQWLKEGFPVSSNSETQRPTKFIGSPDMSMVISTTEMIEHLNDSEWKMIDARSPERFRGEQEPIDPVAGHIPGAVNRFHGSNLGPDGLFLPKEVLRKEFSKILKDTKPAKTVVYCGSGVSSCHHLIAMSYADLPLPRLYVGSWSEWIRDPSRPITRG